MTLQVNDKVKWLNLPLLDSDILSSIMKSQGSLLIILIFLVL